MFFFKIKVNVSFISLYNTACRINMENTASLRDSVPAAHQCAVCFPLCVVLSLVVLQELNFLTYKCYCALYTPSTWYSIFLSLYTNKARTKCLSPEESDTVKVPHQTEVYSSSFFAWRLCVPITGCIDQSVERVRRYFPLGNMELLCV